jgi:Family of unknown function (DUF6370)
MHRKSIVSLLLLICTVCCAQAQSKPTDISVPDTTKKIQIVEASCGECQFHLKGKSCDLAVRIKGKAYFVDGANIDSFGDAHAGDGFCKAISKAAVQGEIVNNRFKVTYFKLLPGTANQH